MEENSHCYGDTKEKTPRMLAMAMGQSNPPMELDELYRMTPWPSRSRSPFEVKVTSKKKLWGDFWPPLGDSISTKFSGKIGNKSRNGNVKGCKIGSKRSQWGWGQSFWGTPLGDQIHWNPVLNFREFYLRVQKTILRAIREFEAAFHATLEDTAPKDPHFRVFSCFAKVWCEMTSQPLQISEHVIYHWKEHKKLNKTAPTQFLILPP